MNFEQGSLVWVWDSTWLPAVVVEADRMGSLLIKLEHGVTFSSTDTYLVARDPARCGDDLPSGVAHRLHVSGPRGRTRAERA
jgi:hypothetical protein